MSEHAGLHFRSLLETPSILKSSPISGVDLFEKIPSTVPTSKLPAKQRLGKFLEAMLYQCFEANSDFKVLLWGEQLIENGQTLGELDFLLEDQSDGSLVHLEMAYKIYLQLDAVEGRYPFYGPKLKDSLEQKLQKLADRQFPLINHPHFQALIADRELRQELWIPGQIYLPAEFNSKLHKLANPESVAGAYMSLADFSASSEQDSYFMPPKIEWFLPPQPARDYLPKEQALPQLKASCAHQHSPLLWVKKTDGSLKKLFITHWTDPQVRI